MSLADLSALTLLLTPDEVDQILDGQVVEKLNPLAEAWVRERFSGQPEGES